MLKPNQFAKRNGNLIPIENLPEMSSERVICVCDICGKEISRILKHYYIAIKKHNGTYICKDCFNHDKKILENRKKNMKETCLEKYGVDNPLKDEMVKNKIKNTLMNKYNVEYSGQIKQAQEKRKQTCFEKYGVENPIVLGDNTKCHSKESKEKAMNTTRKLYGGVGFEIEENRKKAQQALAASGNIRTSTQQKRIFLMLKDIYKNIYFECILNKPLGELFLDISLCINDVYIDVEVDGQYWHQDYQKDRRRDEVVKKQGYKVLRIKFDHELPLIKDLEDSIKKLLNTEHTYYELNLSTCKKSKTQ